MIDPKAVVAHATDLISQQYGPSLGPNIKQLVEVLAHSLAEAINAELKDLLEPVVQIKVDPDVDWSMLHGLSNAPAHWKCSSTGCPDRPSIAAPEAPRCYTCERPMKRAEPEWFGSKDIGATLDEVRRQIATASAMPAKILHSPPSPSFATRSETTTLPAGGVTRTIPPPEGSSITALETVLRAIPEISRCTMSEPHPGDLVVEVAFKPGLDMGDLNVLSGKVKEWLQAYTHAGVIVHYTGFVSYART